MSDERDPVAGLEALASRIKETEAANPSPESQQQEAAAQALHVEADEAAKQWGMLYVAIGGICQMLAPELKAVYTEDRCFLAGQQTHAVAVKYGLEKPVAMPEIALFMTILGFFVPSWFAIKARIKAAQDGTGPATLLSKLGLWWRTRKARAAAKATPAPATEAKANGSS